MTCKLLVALLAVASLSACANNPLGETSREISNPTVYETNTGRMENPQFPSGARSSGN